jgi:RHS repeat-associated protein
MLSRSGPIATTFQYDPRNWLAKVAQGATIARYTYDLDGTRTKRLDANGTVHYLADYERNLGNGSGPDATSVTKYYYAQMGSQRRLLGFRRGGTLYFTGTDHLGGTIRVADASGTPIANGYVRYRPYGAPRDAAAGLLTDRTFTGQTQDAIAGLAFFKARYYDTGLGRFVQPDTIVPDPTNPQALNRYAYGLNNPLKYSDPTGHDPWWNDQGAGTPVPSPAPTADSSASATPLPTGTPSSGWITTPQAATIRDDGELPHLVIAGPGGSIDLGPQESSRQILHWGEVVTIRENVGGERRALLEKLDAPAGVFVPNEIWGRGTIEKDLLTHELGHVEQMTEMGWRSYISEYVSEWNHTLEAAGNDRRLAHDNHPMEIDANRRGGLPDGRIPGVE